MWKLRYIIINSSCILSYQNIGINIIYESVYKLLNLLNIRKSTYLNNFPLWYNENITTKKFGQKCRKIYMSEL